MADLDTERAKRRTFAIISHPDAGKTTLTEKLLLFGGAIQLAGTVKGRKAARHATSDWMELEKQRGISVTSSASLRACMTSRSMSSPARSFAPLVVSTGAVTSAWAPRRGLSTPSFIPSPNRPARLILSRVSRAWISWI